MGQNIHKPDDTETAEQIEKDAPNTDTDTEAENNDAEDAGDAETYEISGVTREWAEVAESAYSSMRNVDIRDPPDATGVTVVFSDTDGKAARNTPDPGDLTPDAIAKLAGHITADDLTDRQKAYYVYLQIRESDDHHFRVTDPDMDLWYTHRESGVWEKTGEQKLRVLSRKALRSEHGSNVVTELQDQLKADPTRRVSRSDMGAPRGTIAVENGLLDLDEAAEVLRGNKETGDEIRPVDPDDHVLRRIPTEYDPGAAIDGTRWAQFVREVCPEEWRDALQEFSGTILCVDHVPVQRALLLVGEGANGKGVFQRAIEHVIEPDDGSQSNISHKSLHDLLETNPSEARAALYGKLANFDNELPAKDLGDGSLFKKLTGEDEISARRPYQEQSFEFTNTASMLFATNSVPEANTDAMAFYRRWLIIEFPNEFTPPGVSGPDRDPDLAEKLADETEVILNWMILGRARLLDQGRFTGEGTKFEKRDRWRKWGDSKEKFIDECVETTKNQKDKIETSELYERYKLWCDLWEEEATTSQSALTKAVKSETGVKYKKNARIDGEQRGRALAGVRFTDACPTPKSEEEKRVEEQERLDDTGTDTATDTENNTDENTDTDTDEWTQEDRREALKTWIEELGNPTVDELVEHAAEQGIAREDAEHDIEELLFGGEIATLDDELHNV